MLDCDPDDHNAAVVQVSLSGVGQPPAHLSARADCRRLACLLTAGLAAKIADVAAV